VKIQAGKYIEGLGNTRGQLEGETMGGVKVKFTKKKQKEGMPSLGTNVKMGGSKDEERSNHLLSKHKKKRSSRNKGGVGNEKPKGRARRSPATQ